MSSTQSFFFRLWKFKTSLLWVLICFCLWLLKLAPALMFLSSEISVTKATRRLQWILLLLAVGGFLIKTFRASRRSNSISQSKVLRVCEDNNRKEMDTDKPPRKSKRKLFMAYESLDHKAAKRINDLTRISHFCSISLEDCAVSAVFLFS